jgi:xylan 1,4-beta-xylosidase
LNVGAGADSLRFFRSIVNYAIGILLCIFVVHAPSYAQTNSLEIAPVQIYVELESTEGSWQPVWSFFGYDEPNYTYTENGKQLLGELRALSTAPVYVRVHNLLTSGDGSSSLKWGSTNAYTEDAAGNPVYDWKIVDRIFDTFHEKGITPLVEVGFMPEALSTHPQPYRHNFPHGDIFTGWAYPPKSYEKWEELVFQFTKHLQDRYGSGKIRNWLWEVWNEPDIPYWKGTQEEFFKLYDYAAQGILRAIPGAKIGGPDSTGAAGDKATAFLKAFLEHCARGTNSATGRPGAPLAFIAFHPKGAPQWKGDHVQMGLERQLQSVKRGFEVVASFPEWRNTSIILGEWDPEGCAACSAKNKPENAYRNTNLYAVYTAEALKDTITLSKSIGVNLQGVVTWSFEFEDQPYFEGFRELATNGIDKPVLNAFRMFGMMSGKRVKLMSDAAAREEDVLHLKSGTIEGVDGIATRGDRNLDLLLWNYREDDSQRQARKSTITITGLPKSLHQAKLTTYVVDENHSNSYAAWKKMGSPQSPTQEQYKQLETDGKLEQGNGPNLVKAENGICKFPLQFTPQSLMLLRFRWAE